MVYLDQMMKPRSLTPPALANSLHVLNMYSVALPTNTGNPPELLTDDKLKAIYFRMMPISSWQNLHDAYLVMTKFVSTSWEAYVNILPGFLVGIHANSLKS